MLPARLAVTGLFFVHGVAIASWVARIPELRHHLELTDGALGGALFVAAGGTVLGLLWIGRVVDRYGSDRVALPAGLAVAAGLAGTGLAPDLAWFLVVLLVFGVAGGLLNVAMNAQAVVIDRLHGRAVISSFHAAYSAGGLLGAGLGALLIWLGVSPAAGLPAIGAGVAVVVLAAVGGGRSLPAQSSAAAGQAAGPRPLGRRVSVLGACFFGCLMAEGVIADWSGVYLTDGLSAPASIAPMGFLVFSVAMALARTVADRLAHRLGPLRLVGRASVVASAGLTMFVATSWWPVGLAGLALFGTGLACITPQLFRWAGREAPDDTGRAVARVATIGYLGLLCGPALIGLTAHGTGLRLALSLLIGVMLGVAALARLAAGGRDHPGR